MDINGKIVHLLEKQSGPSKNGTNWEKQEYILETDGQYPKKVCFNLWGEKIQQFGLNVGDVVTVSIELESREYNGRWYTDVRAWKATKTSEGAVNQTQSSNPPPVDYYGPVETAIDPFVSSGSDGDLPF